MKHIITLIGVIIACLGIGITGQWIYDRSGVMSHISKASSGSLVDQYSTLSESQPRIIDSEIIRDYMEGGVDQQDGRIAHSQQTLASDLLRLRNIQQVGKFVLRDDVPHLFGMMDQLTALSPVWQYPYVFVQQIGPVHPGEDGTVSDTDKLSRQKSIDLGERGISLTCDASTISIIKQLSDEDFVQIVNERGPDYDRLASPCGTYRLPHVLAFNYFYYLKDLEHAIQYYKIAAFHEDAPTVTMSMPAILRGRQGEHLVSAQLWFDRAMSLADAQDETIRVQYDRALAKAIQSLQLHILVGTDESDETCLHDYVCMLQGGSLRRTIQTLAQQCTSDADLSEQIQCILLSQASERELILPDGSMRDPTSETFLGKRAYEEKWGWRFEGK